MVSCKLGHVYIVQTVLTKPPKDKFALCVCIDNGYFLWINTDPRLHGYDQLPLPSGCYVLVKHNSYLDLSRIVAHPSFELEEAREFPCISRELRDLIIGAIDAGLTVLSPKQAAIIKTNLLALYD